MSGASSCGPDLTIHLVPNGCWATYPTEGVTSVAVVMDARVLTLEVHFLAGDLLVATEHEVFIRRRGGTLMLWTSGISTPSATHTKRAPCPDCNDTRRYVGLYSSGPCKTCRG